MIEDKNKNICFLSVVSTDVNDRHIPLYKVILWTKMVLKRLLKIRNFVKKHYKMLIIIGLAKTNAHLSAE